MLDFIFDMLGDLFFDALFAGIARLLRELFGLVGHDDPASVQFVPRLPAGAGVLLAKGGR